LRRVVGDGDDRRVSAAEPPYCFTCRVSDPQFASGQLVFTPGACDGNVEAVAAVSAR
jgi:hypothetical protein